MRIYAIQVASGQEAKVEELIRRFVDEALVGEIFVPRFESMRRWKGEWHKRTERLTPGYLYVETSDAEKLALQLRRVPTFTKVLGNNEVFIPLNDEEVAWLNAFTGGDRRVIEMSEGIVEGNKVIVLRGPLRGHEAEIKRIDRHRRMAELEVSMLGRMKTIRLGLEIISKSPANEPHPESWTCETKIRRCGSESIGAEGKSPAAIGRRKAGNRGPTLGSHLS